MNKSNFTVLGIEPTDDLKTVKKAYAKQISLHHPEDDPEGWRKIHDAYTQIVEELNFKKKAKFTVEADDPEYEKFKAVTEDFEEYDAEYRTDYNESEKKTVSNEDFDETLDNLINNESEKNDKQGYFYDFEESVDDLINEEREKEAKSKEEEFNNERRERMMAKLRQIADFGREVIITEAYRGLRAELDFMWAMTDRHFYNTLVYYFEHLRFSEDIVARVEEDISRVSYYIKENNIETDVRFDNLKNALHRKGGVLPKVETKNSNANTKKKKHRIINSKNRVVYEGKDIYAIVPFVAAVILLFIFFTGGSHQPKKDFYEQKQEEFIKEIDIVSQIRKDYAKALAQDYDNEEDIIKKLKDLDYSEEEIDEILGYVKEMWEIEEKSREIADSIEEKYGE